MDFPEKKFPAAKMESFLGRFRRPISLVVALMVLIAGYFAVLARPVGVYEKNLSLLVKLNGDISAAKGDLEKSKSFSAKIYQLTPAESRILNMSLPNRPDDSSLIAQISSMVRRSGFVVSNIDIQEANEVAGSRANSDNIGKIAIHLKINGGGYGELKQLLRLLNSSLLMIDVNSLNFNNKSTDYDLTLVAYYYNNHSPAGALQ